MKDKISDGFMLLWGILALFGVVALISVSVPLLVRPERPWLGLNPPVAAVRSGS